MAQEWCLKDQFLALNFYVNDFAYLQQKTPMDDRYELNLFECTPKKLPNITYP